MSPISYTSNAEADLREVWKYCEKQFGTNTADATVKRIKSRIEGLLGGFPTAGMQRPEFHKDARSFAEPPNTILYKVTEKGTQVRRILHGKRNITPENISFLTAA